MKEPKESLKVSAIQELEEKITLAWQTQEDLALVASLAESGDADRLSNALIGLSVLFDLRMQQVYSLYEDTVTEYYKLRDDVRFYKSCASVNQTAMEAVQDSKPM